MAITNNPTPEASTATPKSTLKSWFVTAAKPNQAQFAAWMDAYWHKSEYIPIGYISGLSALLGAKADAEQLQYFANKDASNIDVDYWKTVLGVKNFDSQDYYTKYEVEVLLENATEGYATESYVDDSISAQTSQINITASSNITNAADHNKKNVVINNSSNNITITLTTDLSSVFLATYIKEGAGTITFLAGSGVTLKLMDDVAVINGAVGSRAMVSRSGSTFYVYITNY
ncbi:MAG: hypothetical protein QM564_11755 [Bergeyella sp.]